ncbi:hypothetical protein SDC9_189374 [bioreactor metagenome]|uniref:Uncharacterized protein n=1 Tax=bioreactor metagenome TaxID=1076179 RepID=A0A645HUF3_9ZZZZ
MLTPDKPGAFHHAGDHATGNAEVVRQHRGAHYIGDRVDGSHLVKVHLVGIAAVGLRLGHGNDVEYLLGQFAGGGGHVAAVYHLVNIREIAVLMVVMMMMVVAVMPVMIMACADHNFEIAAGHSV